MRIIRRSLFLAPALLLLVSQTPNARAQSISPTNAEVPTVGGTGTVAVTVSGGTIWTATSDDDWIQVLSPASGSGTNSGTVQYSVTPLPDNSTNINRFARVGTLVIAGQVFMIRQHPSGQVAFEAWAASLPAGRNGPGQDAAGDGIPNLVKYALGLDPLTPAKGGLPTISVKDGVWTYTVTKPASVTAVRYTIGRADRLGAPVGWDLSPTKVGEANGMETWRVSQPIGVAAEFLPTAVVQVGVTAREVQRLLNQAFNIFSTNLVLWNIQPGLGTVMIEYGRRMAMLKKAADAGDWGMAQYQLAEATEIQEVGETTRPAKALLLKTFEETYLGPLTQDILAKDGVAFTNDFNAALQGCNACHQLTGHPYVSVQAPTNSPEAFLQLVASLPANPATNAPPAPIAPAPDTPLTWAETWQQISDGLANADTRLALWAIQPGLGTVMMEYGRRFALMKLAADAGDWGMAQYQVAEATEIQEVGETTRPGKAPLLKTFEETYLGPLAQDILAKDGAAFTNDFNAALQACNACHQLTGHPYVRVQLPEVSPEPFLMLAGSDPKTPTTNAPPTPITPTFPGGAPVLADVQGLISNRFSVLDLTLPLWSIQPGLGTVMQEYGYRFTLAWFAAEAGDWPMAQYQLAEAIEIQEVGETTRPSKADLLKTFETTYLDPINAAVAAKDKASFESAYNSAVGACNACHQLTGHPYVRVQISPVMPADFLKLGP